MSDYRVHPLDLSDPGARSVCLSCGVRYTREISRCTSCGGEILESRDTLVSRLAMSTGEPSDGEDIKALVLKPLALKNSEIDSVLAGLKDEGIPHLVFDGRGRLAEPGPAARAILVPAIDLEFIRTRVPVWGGGGEPAAKDPAAGMDPEDTVLLVRTDKEVQSSLVSSRLGEAGVPFFVKQMSSQFGLEIGEFGAREFYVDRTHLAKAEEALADVGADADRPPEVESVVVAGPMQDELPAAGTPEGEDDLEVARLERRFRIARWFIVLPAVGAVVIGILLVAAGRAAAGLVEGALGMSLLWLVMRSKTKPEQAFGWSLVLMLGWVVSTMLSGFPIVIIPGIVGLFAVYRAFEGSVAAAKAAEQKDAVGG